MKISIDTAQDSKDEIRKAIRLLQALVEHHSEPSRNIFEDSSPGLFNDESAGTGQQPASAFADMFNNDAPAISVPEEEKEGVPEVELY